MKQKGITLIEILIVIAIIGIVAAVGIQNFSQAGRDGWQCIGGYRFTYGQRTNVQIFNEEGHGIKCNE